LFEDQLLECYSCGGVFPRGELCAIDEIPGYRWPRYCRHCAEEIRAAYTRHCVLCGAAYMSHLPGDPDSLCPACGSQDRVRELARVRYHLARARAVGLPATLTLGQWLATLEHFGWLCAYCQRQPFTDLDHFVPLASGGGTTAANCVPACARCNTRKSATNPELRPWLPGAAGSLALVRAYLRRQR
jgi:hypothetical protein